MPRTTPRPLRPQHQCLVIEHATPVDGCTAPAHKIEHVAPSPVINYIAALPSRDWYFREPAIFHSLLWRPLRLKSLFSILFGVERVHQHTVAQIVHVPISHIQEQIVEGLKEIPQERFPEQTVEQIVDIPVPPIVEEIAEVMSTSHAAAHAAPTQNIVRTPVCVGDTGFDTCGHANARSFPLATANTRTAPCPPCR